MEIKFPKKVEEITLANYMAEMDGQTLFVWVNPPRQVRIDFLNALHAAADNTTDETINEVFRVASLLLSEGPEETRCAAGELRAMMEEAASTDPRFWPWLAGQIMEKIETYRGNIKKN